MSCRQPGFSVHGILHVHGIVQARILEWVACLSSGDLPNPGIEPRFPTLQADSSPAEYPGKPKNTGVGSVSLLQWIFPTQESNWGLLHCRRILYQLSHQGSPSREYLIPNNDEVNYFLSPCMDGLSVSSVQLLSHIRLCDPMDCSTPGLSVHCQLPEFTQTHVH